MAKEHNHSNVIYQANTPQLVKKFRAEASRLPVNQLINKYMKQSASKNIPLSAPALLLDETAHPAGEQAAR